jgi:photosystem II stability/assembly factor-like uncharacterized protein
MIMKNSIALFFSLLLVCGAASAQWVSLNSTTTVNLQDVDFISADTGVISGEVNTLLKTTDGGITWTDINNGGITGDIHSVKMISADTIFASTFSQLNATGDIYLTYNGGTTWSPLGTISGMIHRIELGANSNLFAGGTDLISTPDFGTSWDTLINYISGTNSLYILKFAGSQVAHLSGLISGITTYSASFYRTDNGGQRWFAGDPFSFPNADALTTMCFQGPDTAYIFTNDYAGFSPSSINGLWKIYNFQKASSIPGDTSFTFTNQIINSAMPAYMNDAEFISNQQAFALGNDTWIYKTTNGGQTWQQDYAAGTPLYIMTFVGGTGYAVGEAGNLVKYTTPSTVVAEPYPGTGAFDVFPFLTSDNIHIDARMIKDVHYEITTAKGDRVLSGMLHQGINTLKVSNFPAGVYMVNMYHPAGMQTRKFAVAH